MQQNEYYENILLGRRTIARRMSCTKTARQTDGWMDIQADKQMDGQTDRQIDRQTDE